MENGAGPMPTSSYDQLHLQATYKGHKNGVTCVQFSPTANTLASASADASLRLWNLQDGEPLSSSAMTHDAGINDVAWNAQGNYLATASDDLTAKIWDAEKGSCLCTLANHTNYVFCCQFNPMGNILVTGSFDETICFWDVRTARCIRMLPAHSDPVTCMDFNYDGTVLASCSFDGLVRLWDTHNGHCLKTLAIDGGSSPLSHVKFSPNGKYLLQASLDSKLRLVNFETGKVVKTYTGHNNTRHTSIMTFVTSIGDSPSIAAGSEDGGLMFWDVGSRQVIHSIPGQAADGTKAEAAAADMQVDGMQETVCNSAASNSVGHTAPVLCVAAHPRKPLLASAANDPDCTIKIWSAMSS